MGTAEERWRERAASERDREQQRQVAAKTQLDAARAQLRFEIQDALLRLEEADWPGGSMLTVRRTNGGTANVRSGLFRRARQRPIQTSVSDELVCWRLGTQRSSHRGDLVSAGVFLSSRGDICRGFSDGRTGVGVVDIAQMDREQVEIALSGLRVLEPR